MRRFTLFALTATIVTLSSCYSKSSDIILDITDGEDYLLGDYYIDEAGMEGIVGYSGTHFKIILSSDETILPWGPTDEIVYQSDSISVSALNKPSFGIYMLQRMIDKGIGRYPAMNWCYSKNIDISFPWSGCWRLPSHYELQLIFTGDDYTYYRGRERISYLNKSLKNIGGTALDISSLYWSCSEDYPDCFNIKGQTLDYDAASRAVPSTPLNEASSIKDFWLKKNNYHVRAIKYVYYD